MQVLRSKGFVWLADNEVMSGEWSQVGSILRLSCGGPWFAALPREAWNTAKVLHAWHCPIVHERHTAAQGLYVMIWYAVNGTGAGDAAGHCAMNPSRAAKSGIRHHACM